jgi:uncharacterized protein involved in type VI secretion and phage assembly
LHEAPPDIGELRTDVPAELAALLFQLMARQRELRPANALVVAEQLDAIVLENAEGESINPDLGAFMAENFAELRKASEATIQAAIDALEQAPQTFTGSHATMKAPRWLWASGVLAAIGVAALAAAFFVNPSAKTARNEPTSSLSGSPQVSLNVPANDPKTATLPKPQSREIKVEKHVVKRATPAATAKLPSAPKSYRDAPIFTKWK